MSHGAAGIVVGVGDEAPVKVAAASAVHKKQEDLGTGVQQQIPEQVVEGGAAASAHRPRARMYTPIQQPGPYGAGKNAAGLYYDVEAGEGALYPGISEADNELRWGFVRKVFGIVSAQLVLTTLVAGFIVFNARAREALLLNQGLFVLGALSPFLTMLPLYCYRNSHPVNLVLLALFTASISFSVGVACAFAAGMVVLEAVALTASVVMALTAYSFYASRKGHDFSSWGPMLFSALWVLIIWGFIQMFFSPGPIAQTIYALAGALLFSCYIVFDVQNLIMRFSIDEYVWASVTLYLDIINLFLRLLEILQALNGASNNN